MDKSLRRGLIALFIALTVVIPNARPASAVTGSAVPDNEHSFVGVVAFFDASGAFSNRCSGSLLTSTVFLTAGDCVTSQFWGELSYARVYLQQNVLADTVASGYRPRVPGPRSG